MVEPSLGSLKILSQLNLFFKQYQWQQGNVQCVQGAYAEYAFEEFDEIFYIVQPNDIF